MSKNSIFNVSQILEPIEEQQGSKKYAWVTRATLSPATEEELRKLYRTNLTPYDAATFQYLQEEGAGEIAQLIHSPFISDIPKESKMDSLLDILSERKKTIETLKLKLENSDEAFSKMLDKLLVSFAVVFLLMVYLIIIK